MEAKDEADLTDGRSRADLPNLLYIGADKAGSTWFEEFLRFHPAVFLPSVKDIYFFDRYFDRGIAWYASHFKGSGGYPIVAELSHDYLYDARAARRIAEAIPVVRLVAFLREPVSRAFSSYLYLRKFGAVGPDFEQAIRKEGHGARGRLYSKHLAKYEGHLVDHGRYAKHLTRYFDAFPRESLFVGIFEDLVEDPRSFATRVAEWIRIEPLELPDELQGARLAAAQARSPAVARAAKRAAMKVRDAGLDSLVGRAKRSLWLQKALFREYEPGAKPMLTLDVVERLRPLFAEDVGQLDRLTGLDLSRRWGYS